MGVRLGFLGLVVFSGVGLLAIVRWLAGGGECPTRERVKRDLENMDSNLPFSPRLKYLLEALRCWMSLCLNKSSDPTRSILRLRINLHFFKLLGCLLFTYR